jgi:hypothetical protein
VCWARQQGRRALLGGFSWCWQSSLGQARLLVREAMVGWRRLHCWAAGPGQRLLVWPKCGARSSAAVPPRRCFELSGWCAPRGDPQAR